MHVHDCANSPANQVAAELRAVRDLLASLRRAGALLRAGRPASASAAFTAAIALAPWHDAHSAVALCGRAAAAAAEGMPRRAWEDCTEALRRRRSCIPIALLRRARAARTLGLLSEAVADLEACVQIAEAIDAPSELCGWHSRAVGAAAGNLPPVQELKSELAALRAAAKQGGVEASGFEPPPSSDSTRPPPNNDWPGKAPRGATPKWRNSFGNADTYAASAASEAARRRPAFAGLGNDDSDDADRAGGMEGNRGPTQQPGSFNSNPPGASSCAGASPRAYQCSGGDDDDVDSRASEWGLYGTLGIRPNASYADIRRAFRRMALQCHPDKVQTFTCFRFLPRFSNSLSLFPKQFPSPAGCLSPTFSLHSLIQYTESTIQQFIIEKCSRRILPF